MDNQKSYEFTFLYLINKCILLFKYINNTNQQEILQGIKIFINKLYEIFSKADFSDNNEKKNKILEILIKFFEKIIDEKIYLLLDANLRDNIIDEVNKKSLSICEKNKNNNININNIEYEFKQFDKSNLNLKKYGDELNSNQSSIPIENKKDKNNEIDRPSIDNELRKSTSRQDINRFSEYSHRNIEATDSNNYLKENNIINKNISNKDLLDLEKKFNNKIKLIFIEIENNIKLSLTEHFNNLQYIEKDLDKKINIKLENNNNLIENKIKDIIRELFNNDKIYEYINNNIKYQFNDIYNQLENIIKNKDYTLNEKQNNLYFDEKILEVEKNNDYKIDQSNYDIKKKLTIEIENKIKILGNIFNENIQQIFNNINERILDNEKDLKKTFDEKIGKAEFNKNNFTLNYDKDTNEIKLLYNNDIVANSKINIKGLIGPKGPVGNTGAKGDTPIFRKVGFSDDKKLKFVVQDSSNIYEIISEQSVPLGPQGNPGERGPPGNSYMNLKWDQDDVMKIDSDHKDSLIFLKSLCIGDKSHCLKDNSMSIGGGICYNNNSIAIGNNSKTLDSESIALFGSTIGKKSFSYRADNVDENTVQFGKKEKNNYLINSFNINSKEINFDCDTLNIKYNKYENKIIKELEDRIILLEKKITDILRNK